MIEVTCAIIEDGNGKVLVTQRSSKMDLPLKWEFPGGKVEFKESPEDCLVREIKEELAVGIAILKRLPSVKFSYPQKDILLIPFICKLQEGILQLKEHNGFKWLKPDELMCVDWAEADVHVVKEYLNEINEP